MENIKKEISDILSPLFGNEVKKMIEENYDNKDSAQLLGLATHMLTSYLGEGRANEMLSAFMKKHPELKYMG